MNEIELLNEIRMQQRLNGKDVIGYGAIACLATAEALRSSGSIYHAMVAAAAGVISFAKLVAYDDCITIGDKLQKQYIEEMHGPL